MREDPTTGDGGHGSCFIHANSQAGTASGATSADAGATEVATAPPLHPGKLLLSVKEATNG